MGLQDREWFQEDQRKRQARSVSGLLHPVREHSGPQLGSGFWPGFMIGLLMGAVGLAAVLFYAGYWPAAWSFRP